MATGDHILTAMSVSRECQIINDQTLIGVIKFNNIRNFPEGLIESDKKT